jgi:ABC-type transporter Mla MlaB component
VQRGDSNCIAELLSVARWLKRSGTMVWLVVSPEVLRVMVCEGSRFLLPRFARASE